MSSTRECAPPRSGDQTGLTWECTCGRIYTTRRMYGRVVWYRREDPGEHRDFTSGVSA